MPLNAVEAICQVAGRCPQLASVDEVVPNHQWHPHRQQLIAGTAALESIIPDNGSAAWPLTAMTVPVYSSAIKRQMCVPDMV